MAVMTERYDPTDTEESEIEEPLPPRSQLAIETNTTAIQPAQDVRQMQDENNDSDSQEQEIIYTRAGYFAMYSRKVFVGGIPYFIDPDIINKFFDQFGKNIIDWPHRDCCDIRAPPNGFVFVIFNRESAVHRLINATEVRHGKRLIVMKNDDIVIKTVQVKPWILSCLTYSLSSTPFVGRYSIFVRGFPRTMTAMELAHLFEQVIGNVVEVHLGVEYGIGYPRGSARVIFGNHEAFHVAIAMRCFTLCTFRKQRTLEMRPYVLDDMWCDICHKTFAHYLCPELPCLLYYCIQCWLSTHQEQGMDFHRPVSAEILGLWKNGRKNQRRHRNRYVMQRSGHCCFQQRNLPSEPDYEAFSGGNFPIPPQNAS
uniref:RRM domain-containing protein n=1 Tax=Onchocerca volvulus TaxID=6282 RepID=A0A8R1TVX4_ONCVO